MDIKKILEKLDPEEKDVLLEALLSNNTRRQMKPCMTINDFSDASGIPEKRVRQATKGQYAHKICVSSGENCTAFIKTTAFMKLWEEGKLC